MLKLSLCLSFCHCQIFPWSYLASKSLFFYCVFIYMFAGFSIFTLCGRHQFCFDIPINSLSLSLSQGRIQDFKLGGAHLKKLRRAEEGAKILGVFRVKNHYFTPKNHSFYNYEGRREKCWGISCENSRFYAKKTYFFPILGGGARRVRPPPPWIRPC